MKNFIIFILLATLITVSAADAQWSRNQKKVFTTKRSLVVEIDSLYAKTLTGVKGELWDTTAFDTTATRLARPVAGGKVTNKYFVQPRVALAAPFAEVLPIAADFCVALAKADSVIILRAAGTTSGLKIQWLRIK